MRHVELEIAGTEAGLRLCAASRGNSLDRQMVSELLSALREAMHTPDWRVLVLSAEGPAFCRGLDLEHELQQDAAWVADTAELLSECLKLLVESHRPVVAVVEGDVVGGGLGLVAACDLVIASRAATFAATEALIGLIPAVISPFLARRMGYARLRYLALSTLVLDAQQAQGLGLVDEVVEGAMAAALKRQLQRLLRSSPAALAEIKRYTRELQEREHAQGANLAQQCGFATAALRTWLARPGVLEGVREFAAGGTPPWWNSK
jgi:methylglutaconyl-CoA hydratase/polyketide biosynthesis enoyl-CoA hydratase PksH